MIYVASPFTHPDKLVMGLRRNAAFRYTANLIEQGKSAFSPIVYGWPFFIEHRAPPNFEFWQDFNERMLYLAEEVHVLQLDGWDRSRGIAHEIDFSTRIGTPIRYIMP